MLAGTYSSSTIQAKKSSAGSLFLIGIDPGRETGVCAYDRRNKKIMHMESMPFWDAIDFIASFHYHGTGLPQSIKESDQITLQDDYKSYEVVIEDPGLNTFLHSKFYRNAIKVQTKIAQNVGMNKEDAYLIIEYMKRKRIKYRQIRPSSVKWTAADFKKITRWEGKLNQHMIDAGRMVYGL